MVMRFEELEPVPSEDGWTLTVQINEIDETPRGSRHVLRSESYNYKAGPDNEADDMKKRRLKVKKVSRRKCLDKFDEAKSEAKKAKRRKGAPASAATPLAPLAPLLWVSPAGPLPVPPPLPADATAPAAESDEDGPDEATERDWALLRAFKMLKTPAAVLRELSTKGFLEVDDDEEPWSEQRLQERHAFLCRCVNVHSRLMRGDGSNFRMRTLACLCG